jgi:hypothetical protein
MALSNDAVVSEESLRDLFNNFGPVFDCAIKKLCKDPVSALRVSRAADAMLVKM